MSFIHKIIEVIDAALLQSVDAVAHGLCVQKILSNDTIAPVKMSDTEMEYVIFNDNHDTSFYHRAEQVEFKKNDDNIVSQVFQVNLVLHSKVERCVHSILEQILASLPRHIGQKKLREFGLRECFIDPESAELNAMNVFGTECKKIDFKIPPENILICLRYQLRFAFEKKCLPTKCNFTPNPSYP